MTHVCDCGAVYADLAGLEACQIGNHGSPRIIRDDDVPPHVLQRMKAQDTVIQELRQQLVGAHKRLCHHEGHLPIVDAQGRTWVLGFGWQSIGDLRAFNFGNATFA